MSTTRDGRFTTNAKSARFSAKPILLVVIFCVVPAVLVYLCMGASTSQNMSQPYIVKATAKHTASVSELGSQSHSLRLGHITASETDSHSIISFFFIIDKSQLDIASVMLYAVM